MSDAERPGMGQGPHAREEGGVGPPPGREARRADLVIAYVPDLLDRSKLVAAGGVSFVQSPDELAQAAADAELVVVDLTKPGVVEALPAVRRAAPDVRLVGFANHTRRELMDAAKAAGCDEVLARSAFFPRLAEVLGR